MKVEAFKFFCCKRRGVHVIGLIQGSSFHHAVRQICMFISCSANPRQFW